MRQDGYVQGQLTALDELWNAYPGLVGRLNAVYLEAQLYLRDQDLQLCHQMIRDALMPILGRPTTPEIEALLISEVERAETCMSERAERTGRKRYAGGLYVGAVVSLVVMVLIGLATIVLILLFLHLRGQETIPNGTMSAVRDILICICGGTAGAVISTIIRVSAADRIDYKTVTARTAAFRIVLGWLFAVVLFFLVKGEIVTVFKAPDPASPESFFFWGGVGVLAGFNEVWARNLITRPKS